MMKKCVRGLGFELVFARVRKVNFSNFTKFPKIGFFRFSELFDMSAQHFKNLKKVVSNVSLSLNDKLMKTCTEHKLRQRLENLKTT